MNLIRVLDASENGQQTRPGRHRPTKPPALSMLMSFPSAILPCPWCRVEPAPGPVRRRDIHPCYHSSRPKNLGREARKTCTAHTTHTRSQVFDLRPGTEVQPHCAQVTAAPPHTEVQTHCAQVTATILATRRPKLCAPRQLPGNAGRPRTPHLAPRARSSSGWAKGPVCAVKSTASGHPRNLLSLVYITPTLPHMQAPVRRLLPRSHPRAAPRRCARAPRARPSPPPARRAADHRALCQPTGCRRARQPAAAGRAQAQALLPAAAGC